MLFLMMMVVMLMVVMAAAALMLFLMMMVMVFMLLLKLCQFGGQRGLAFHCLQQLCAGQFSPRGGDDGSFSIVLPQQFHGGIQLFLRDGICTGQDDGGGGFDLVVVELTEVLAVDPYLAGIHNSNGIAQGHVVTGDLVDGTDDIRQLANTGRLDEDSVGMVLFDNLLQSLAKVTHQRAADTAGVHLSDVDACILQETTVNTDLTKLILDQNQLLACIGLLDHFLNECGFACTQETTVNINFRHRKHTFSKNSLQNSITRFPCDYKVLFCKKTNRKEPLRLVCRLSIPVTRPPVPSELQPACCYPVRSRQRHP